MKCALCLTLSTFTALAFFGVAVEAAAEPAPGNRTEAPSVRWLNDYAKATTAAEGANKMLLIYFCDSAKGGLCEQFDNETLSDPQVRRQMHDYVCLKLPMTAKIVVQGKPVVLLEHDSFGEMQGKPGIAVVDYRSSDTKLRGAVVSQFPLTETLRYTPDQMAVILTLPPGTLTQRTMIYAVRIHPDRPQSTEGEVRPELLEEAESHSQYQANTRVQGHQFWESRFQRIVARLARRGGGAPREVCAESWGGQNLVDGAIECVRCWRLSSGHWSAVSARSRFFGYDIKRGGNGVWYATGIVDE
jgi:hypothetical protein